MKKAFYENRPLVLSLLTSIAMASTEVPLWISVFAFLMIAWKYAHEKYNMPKLSVKLTPVLGLIIFAIVYLQYRTILGQEESTTVLLGLVSLSILNYETDRDTLFLVLLGFLIVVIKSVFSLDFIWVIPALFSFFGLWYSLLANVRIDRIRFLFWTTLKSLPALAILFVLFPRLVIFQSKPAQRALVQSGFNEDLNPGRFSEVALQNQMVFRAEFKNNNMNTEELYWRGSVLNVSKGFIWQKGNDEKFRSYSREHDEEDQGIDYKVVLEPLGLRNVFVLDTPVKIKWASSPVSRLKYQTYALSEFGNQQVQFEAQSVFNMNEVDGDDPTDMQKFRFFPELPPRTKAWVEDVKAKYATPKDRIDALKRFFVQKGFIYTLKPEFYRNNLDEFLFERKKGFCEHFAAAFGTVARALDVPSRVVIGYQGGVYNSLGNFWKVSQKDAHAWVEVGLNGRWTRVDPTGLVTPLRLTLGGEEYFALSEDEQILNSKNPKWKKDESSGNAIIQAKLFLENLNYSWTIFLLNYDMQAQLDYFRQFQGNWLVGAFFIALFILFLIYTRNRKQKRHVAKNEMQYLVLNIESWAAKKGLRFADSQTPLQILHQVSEKYPETQAIMTDISVQYESLVYREKKTQTRTQDLNKNWKNISKKVS